MGKLLFSFIFIGDIKKKMKDKNAVFSGTFDPITNGHMDIIKRGSKLFRTLIIAIPTESEKKTLFDFNLRVKMVKSAIEEHNLLNVKVEGFKGLIVDYLKERKINIILRGLRSTIDYEYEKQMSLLNKDLSKNKIETIFLISSPNTAHISSKRIKEIAKHSDPNPSLTPTLSTEMLKKS